MPGQRWLPDRALTADELLSPKAPVWEQAAGSTPVSAPPPVRETEALRPEMNFAPTGETEVLRSEMNAAPAGETEVLRPEMNFAPAGETEGAALSRWGDRSRPFPASPCQGRKTAGARPEMSYGGSRQPFPAYQPRLSLLPASPATVARPATSL